MSRHHATRRSSVHLRDLIVNGLAAWHLLPRKLRWRIYRAYGLEIATPGVRPGCFFGGRDVRIGPGTFINYGCFFDNLGRIEIGAGCRVGMRVMVVTSNHELGGPEQRGGRAFGQRVSIGDGCWIGAGAVILPGVTIGPGAVVAAGAVVTGDCEPNAVYAGNPARKMRDL